MRRLIIDTDTASDDAVALMMALRYPGVSVEAITLVAGNVPVPQGSKNARFIIEQCGAEVPVYHGCQQPLSRAPAIADWFHGKDGMGNMYYPDPTTPAQSANAPDELIRRFSASRGVIDLVTLGPLTNIATALAQEPEFARWVRHCYVMGGAACTVGNVTPAAEYNIWCDPEAAYRVFHSGMPITMIGWELSRDQATLNDSEIQTLRALNTPLAQIAMDCNGYALKAVREIQGEQGLALADPVAMAIALDNSLATRQSQHYVDISLDNELTRGMTVVDQLRVTGKSANVTVCWSLDTVGWKHLLHTTLSA